jgi:hypothetical protein
MLLDAIYQSNQIAKDQFSRPQFLRPRGVTIVRTRFRGVNTVESNFGFFLRHPSAVNCRRARERE